MSKKFILLVIVLLAVGLVLVSAQTAQEMEAINRLQADVEKRMIQALEDMQAGRITAQEYQRRSGAMQQEMREAVERILQGGSTFTQAQLRRIEELHEQAKVLEAQANEGRINRIEAERQVSAISAEIEQITSPLLSSAKAMQQLRPIEDIIKARWPGTSAGWPLPEGERGYQPVTGVGPLRQASGTRASYSYSVVGDSIYEYNIYQTGATVAMLQDLRRQIEASLGITMENIGTNRYLHRIYYMETNDGYRYFHIHAVSLSSEGVLLYRWATGNRDRGSGTESSGGH
jgi:hypothetical protein